MASAADSGWVFTWRRTWREVFEPAFVEQWDALRRGSQAASPFQSPAVARAWVETCGEAIGCEPLFGIASRGNMRILLPWVVVTNRGRFVTRRTIEGVGQDLYGYHDPIVSPRSPDPINWVEFWAAAREATAALCHQALLRSVHATYATGDSTAAESAPVLRLEGLPSIEAVLARCSASHRGKVHRCLRQLSERGTVALRVFGAGDAAAAARAFEELASAYEVRRQARPDYPSFSRPGLRALWQRVATEGVAGGWGHLAMLTVSGEPVAWHLGLFEDGALYWWVPTHAARWEPWSPGKALLAKLLSHGIVSGWHAVHFMAGAQPYKMAWRPEVPERRVIRWHSPTLTGALLKRYDRVAAV